MLAAIFDMDGTLLDSMGMWMRLAPNFMKRHGIAPTDTLVSETHDMSLYEAADYLAAHFDLGMTADEIRLEWDAQVLNAYLTEVQPKPFVPEYLQALRRCNIKTAVATLTSHALADRALAHHGLTALFDCILTTEDVGGVGKERPALFLEAARRLGAPVGETVVFEDSLYAIRTAVSAGFPVFAIAEPHQPECEIRRLSQRYFHSFGELLGNLGKQSVSPPRARI